MPSRMEHEKVGLARVIELIRNSPERRYGHAVFIMDRVYPEDSTFLEAFIDQPEAQQYLEELRPHFGRRRLDWRIRKFVIFMDAGGVATTAFYDGQRSNVSADELAESLTTPDHTLRLPLLVMVPLEGVISASQVTHELYCFNATESGMWVSAEADFFTTTDEDTGEGIHHGPQPVVDPVLLTRGECTKVGDIEGWEWDSGMSFDLTVEIYRKGCRLGYDLKSSRGRRVTLPGQLKGYAVNPDGRPIRLAWAAQYPVLKVPPGHLSA